MCQRLQQFVLTILQAYGGRVRARQVEYFPASPPMRLQRLGVAVRGQIPRSAPREEVAHERKDYTEAVKDPGKSASCRQLCSSSARTVIREAALKPCSRPDPVTCRPLVLLHVSVKNLCWHLAETI